MKKVTFQDKAMDRESLASEALTLIDQELISERDAIDRIAQLHNITNWKIRSAFYAIVFETMRYRNLIDFIINKIMKKGKIDTIKNVFLRNLLRIGIYEIKIAKKPSMLVCNTLVEIVKNMGLLKASKFFNAIVHSSDRFNLSQELSKLNEIEYLSLKYAHPKWYIKFLTPLFSKQFIISLLKQNNIQLPTCIRIIPSLIDKEDVIAEFKAEKFQYRLYPELPDMIEILNKTKPINETKSYKSGGIYTQSKSSILVSHILDPQPRETIYDITAAPGNKTTHIAELMENKGKIIAIDRSFRRLKELKEKIRFFKIKIIEMINYDSKYFKEDIIYKPDKIVLDPPCSGTGTFPNRPTMKWFKMNEQMKNITSIQWKLLIKALKLVKSGGIILYSTCSITLEENEELINRLLKEYTNVKLLDQFPFIGKKGLLGLDKTQRLFPHIHQTEGFFIAKLQKTS